MYVLYSYYTYIEIYKYIDSINETEHLTIVICKGNVTVNSKNLKLRIEHTRIISSILYRSI